MLATGWQASINELAELFGVDRATVWSDCRKIRAFEPPRTLDGFDESEAIRQTIDFYETAIAVLIGEFSAIAEFEKKKADEIADIKDSRRSKIFNPYNSATVKIGIMNALAMYRRDLSAFLFTAGLVVEAPKRLLLEAGEGLSTVTTAEEFRTAAAEIKKDLALLRKRINEIGKKKVAKKCPKKKKAVKKK